MTVSVLIPAQNRPESLSRCLGSVLEQMGVEYEVIVFDDASTPPLCRTLTDTFVPGNRVTFLRSETPVGPAQARNELARRAAGDYLCFFDDDVCLPGPHVLKRLVEVFHAYPEAGIVAFKILDHRDGKIRILSPVHHHLRLDDGDSGRARPVSSFMEAAYAVPRPSFERTGGYCPDLVFGHVGFDLAFRYIGAGYHILYVPSLQVHHYYTAHGSVPAERRQYFQMRNRIRIAWRYLPWKYLPVHVATWILFYGIRSVRNGHVGAFWRGVRDGFKQAGRTQRRPVSGEALAYLKKYGGRLWW